MFYRSISFFFLIRSEFFRPLEGLLETLGTGTGVPKETEVRVYAHVKEQIFLKRGS